MSKGRPKIGTFVGTGAAVNVVCGFVPDYVRIINITDRDETYEWFSSMPAGTAVSTLLAVAGVASNGVSPLNSATLGAGFIAGTAISESGDTYAFAAYGNEA